MSREASTGADSPPEGSEAPAHVEDLLEDLEALERAAAPSATDDLAEVRELLAEAHRRGLIDSGVRRLDPDDVAEAFVGSVIFASPLLIEDGVFDIATHLFQSTVAGLPGFLVANTAFVVLMTYALLEWTGRDKREVHTLFGVVPARVLMILGVSFVVAALLMTVWGRVEWAPPAEAIARINVIWTVGSLGAALGDILSGDEASPAVGQTAERLPAPSGMGVESAPADELTNSELVESIQEQFDELEATVGSHDQRRAVRELRAETFSAAADDTFGDRIRKYTGRDIAEGFVGSIFFSIGFLVEDGVYDVADYFLSFRIGLFPVFFLANTAFVVAMIWGLVYWAGPQDVKPTRPLLGFVPRRLVGIALVSYLTAAALMTMWGRVADWNDPVVALARISVVWTVASFGAALGDILPGESSGDDINDDVKELVEAARGEDSETKA